MKLSNLDLTNSVYLEQEYKNQVAVTRETSFDSFHNSFFSSYWNKYSVLSDISLNIEVKGEGTVYLIKNLSGSESVLDSVNFNSKSDQKLKLNTKVAQEDGARFYFKVNPNSEVIIKNNVSWETSQNVNKTVKLAIIMCTFNKQDYIQKNLDLLLNSDVFKTEDIELIIVDNAANLNIIKYPKVHYFSQENYGGSGGFTRGLIEARKMQRFSHYQFMDDDILLLPEMIFRAKRFIEFSNGDYCFSGSMLCMDKKNTIWESGANYPHPNKLLTPNPCFFNQNLDNSLLNGISTPYDFDYGGWWFYTFSEEIINEVGLPFPFFIRGDDVEFSLRVKKAGFKSISLPGICVWHETFFGKTGFWLQYYNTRNYLVLSLLYYNWPETIKLAFQIFKVLVSDLLFFQYQRVKILNKALFDFQWSIFSYHEKSTPSHQAKLMKEISDIKEDCMPSVFPENIQSGNFIDIFLRVLTLNGHLIPAFNDQVVYIFKKNWKPRLLKSSFSIGTNKIVVSNRNINQNYTFVKSPAKFIYLGFITVFNLITFIILLPVYRVIIPIIFQKYKTTEFWNKFLKI